MRNRFDEQLSLLNHELLEMGALVESAIRSATTALVNQDVEAALASIAADKDVDQAERDIESLCLKLLLQQQPVARDLRLISSALKMITDMERIGDQASDIAELVIYLSKEPYIKELTHLPQMAEHAIRMVTEQRAGRLRPQGCGAGAGGHGHGRRHRRAVRDGEG